MNYTSHKLSGIIAGLLVIASVFLFHSCSEFNTAAEKKEAKYVFYFIGDGMGLAQSSITEAYLADQKGYIGFEKLSFSTFPVQSYSSTYAQTRLITGSAAAGTALATGHKTSIGTISMDAEHENAYKSIAEKARDNGLKIGIITSVDIEHATPAVFYAHVEKRNEYYTIGKALAESSFNFFGGGGFRYPDGRKREKDTNLLAYASENGYKVVNDKQEFLALKSGDDKVLAINPELDSESAMPFAIDRREGELSLADYTAKAIELLDNENGFFIMVEGGKIDWSCHANDLATTIHEVIDFDAAVKKALEFYNAHPDETLILVTADHETGGLALGCKEMHYESNLGIIDHQKCSGDAFTTILGNYFKENTKDASFEGVMELVSDYFGLGDEIPLSDDEVVLLKKAYAEAMGGNNAKPDKMIYGAYNLITACCTNLISQKAGAGWTSNSHTASPVPVRVIGPGAEKFSSFTDNTDLPRMMEEIMGIK